MKLGKILFVVLAILNPTRAIASSIDGGAMGRMYYSERQTLTITAGIYGDLDALGGNIFWNWGGVAGSNKANLGGKLVSVTLVDLGKQNAAIDIVCFSRTHTATADNDPFDPVDAELSNAHLFTVKILPGDYTSFADSSEATYELEQAIPMSSTSLICQCQVHGTPTYPATDAISIEFKIEER